jgi:hypothetical protein
MGFDVRLWLHSRLCSAAIVSAALLALAGAGGMTVSARAATYTVGTTEDLPGLCEVPTSGTCSLRQLITYENNLSTTPNPPDKIVVPANFYLLANGNGVLTIFRSVSIVGAGARTTTIEQSFSTPDRVFVVEPNPRTKVVPSVVISGLAIEFGQSNSTNGFFGGDILNEGTLTLSEDLIYGGTAASGSGGGISNYGGTLTVTHSLVYNNTSTNPNGGGDSGGIQNVGPNPVTGTAGKLVIDNSTITDNTAALGGGIFSWCSGAEGACSSDGTSNTTTITDSTIANNDGGTRSTEGGGLLASQGTISVENSIVAGNTVDSPAAGTPSNCAKGGISSLGHNLESGTDCGFTKTGDRQETQPKFSSEGPQNNGGNTDTLGLEPTSPAVDAIPANNPLCAGVSDQRGIARPQGAGCDIGAFEMVQLQATEGAQFSGQVATNPSCGGIERSPPPPAIEWGDGQTSQGTVDETGTAVIGAHTYAEEGTYIGSASFHNDCGQHRVSFQVDVADAPLTATGVPVRATAGAQFTAPVATFTDADPGGVASDYTATIAWGDGKSASGTVSARTGGGFEVKGSHTYAAAGQYKTSVTISDVGGAKATATGSATVVGPPVVSNVSVLSVTETTATIDFTIDPDGADTTYVIEYGPNTNYGQKTAPVDIGSTRGPQSLTRTLTGLTPNTTYHFDVVATNSAAPKGVGGGDQTFTTEPDAPLSATGESVSGMAGVKLSATVATFTDADPNGVVSDYTASIDWGDGSTTAGTISAAAGGGFAVTGSHTYAAGGQYTTSLTINDVGGAKATATGSATAVGPPVVSDVSVVSVTETTATIGFTIDPAGADTNYVVEYGPDTSYGQRTAPVDIGAAGGPQSLTRTLTGLEPNGTYHFNVIATNSGAPGGVGGGDQPFTTVQPSPPFTSPALGGATPHSGVLGVQSVGKAAATLADLPPPVLGKSVNVEPVSGKVLIALPGTGHTSRASSPRKASESLSKGLKFIPLTEARQIPVGSILDTSAGVARIETATASRGMLQSGDFGAGLFKLLQRRHQRGLTELNIIDNHSARQVCATHGKARIAAKHPSSKVLGRLSANSHGRFTAHGQYSAATVRGTIWSVANRCDGTLTRVKRGVLSVRDFHRRKTITLFTGQAYLAQAP